MRNDLNDIIAAQPTQHSLDWYRARLGKFTGSQVGRLMKSGRGKDEYFGKDALAAATDIIDTEYTILGNDDTDEVSPDAIV